MIGKVKQLVPYDDMLYRVRTLLTNEPCCGEFDVAKLLLSETGGIANWNVGPLVRVGRDYDYRTCWEKILPHIRRLREDYDVMPKA